MSLRIKLLLVVSLTILMSFSSLVAFSGDEPKQGGTLDVAVSYGNIHTLDPHLSTGVTPGQAIEQIFDGLVAIESGSLDLVPEVAKNWIVSQDGKTYWFKLRKNVKFHNGEELTASDFKFSVERLGDPDLASPQLSRINLLKGSQAYKEGEADEITGVTVIDDYTLRIDLSEFSPAFLYDLAQINIVPEDVVKEMGEDFANNPVGSGPFKFESWRRDSIIKLSAFEDYYAGRPYLDNLNFKIMLEAGARQAAFDSKGIDFMLANGTMYEKYREMPESKVKLLTCAELFTRNMILNFDYEPLSHRKVRQAINYAIDNKALIDNILRGKAVPAVGWLPTTMPVPDEDLEGYPYNPEKAKELMKEAGYEDGFSLEIMASEGGGGAYGLRVVEAIMPFLREIGIDAEMIVRDFGTASDLVGQGKFQARMYSNGGEVSPFKYLEIYFNSERERYAGNSWGYDNPEVDALLGKARTTTDFDERMEIIAEAHKLVTRDAPSWFYNYNKAVAVVQPWVKGLVANPRDNAFHDYDNAWLDK
ncbi:ABC transporter substrate-binding protein [Candidatus Bipolaricaulota bacterium]|nr:ABC transporter substrate-binding protein [Candidatus Bipolaricaulota bacterium]